jgi:hypothetical protein
MLHQPATLYAGENFSRDSKASPTGFEPYLAGFVSMEFRRAA